MHGNLPEWCMFCFGFIAKMYMEGLEDGVET